MKKIVCLIFTLFSLMATAQNFVNPLAPPLLLSGSFAELRSNHFHTGIDIKTNNKIGKPVIAIADGYISRIKISPYGFGKVLYLTHYDGYMSVYAHLSKFRNDIWQYVQGEQYKQKKCTIELFPLKTKFKIHQGDTIGFSGNSGSSDGPHLHFEIRIKNNQHPVNPVKMGFDIKDTIAPAIYKISLTSFPSYETTQKIYKCLPQKDTNGKMKLYSIVPETLKIDKPTGIAIKTYDYYNNSTNICGVNAVSMLLDGKKFFGYQLDEFSYSKKRYVNSLVDFPYYIRTKERFQRLYKQPNNQLPVYFPKDATGKIDFTDTLIHEIKIIVTDSKNNTSMLLFYMQGPTSLGNKKEYKGVKFPYNQANRFENDTFSISFPLNALYDDLDFTYKTVLDNKFYSPVITICSKEIPLQKKVILSIKANQVEPKYKSKLTIVQKVGKHFYNVGGYYKNGNVTSKTYKLGTFAISIDTIPPKIKPLNIYDNVKFINDTSIRFRITDNLSGIQNYHLFIDGKWGLLDYDYRSHTLTYLFDKHVEKNGKLHTLQLTVIDGKGNTGYYTTKFYY